MVGLANKTIPPNDISKFMHSSTWQISNNLKARECLLGSGPESSSMSPLSFKTIFKNQKWLTYKNIKPICKIRRNFHYVMKVKAPNTQTKHRKVTETKIKLLQFWNDWLYARL